MSGKDSLLIDIGNTAAKLARFNGRDLFHSHTVSIEQLPQCIDLAGVEKIWFSNVNDKALSQLVKHYEVSHQVPCFEVLTTPQAFGLNCAYANYLNLGVDRWLAMLAIHGLESRPFAVIDAGTALTCDLVDGDAHLGGWIAPGFDMMRTALQKGAKHVFTDLAYPTHQALGKDTPDCVNYGCMAYMRGCVNQARDYLKTIHSDYRIYISGGSQSLLSFENDKKVVLETNLVLKGLQRFAAQN